MHAARQLMQTPAQRSVQSRKRGSAVGSELNLKLTNASTLGAFQLGLSNTYGSGSVLTPGEAAPTGAITRMGRNLTVHA